jgi:hypothetical protein
MPKRVQKRRMSKRMSKKGGYFGEEVVNGVVALPGNIAQGVVALPGNVVQVVDKTKQGVQETGSWFGSLFGNPGPNTAVVAVAPGEQVAVVGPAPVQPVAVAPGTMANPMGGSRRHKRSGKKSKNMFSGLMNMMGLKTKKRGRKGGIGGPYLGFRSESDYFAPEFASFPSAANAQGNTLYDLAPFDPLKPFTGGMKRVRKGVMKGGCMSKLVPLTPADYPNGVSDMFGGKTMRRRKRCGGKSKKHSW